MSTMSKWIERTGCAARLATGLVVLALCAQAGCGGTGLPEQPVAPAIDPDLEPEPEPEPEPEDLNRSPPADAGADLEGIGGHPGPADGAARRGDDGEAG